MISSPDQEDDGIDPNGLVNNVNLKKRPRNSTSSATSGSQTANNNIRNKSTLLERSALEPYQGINSLEVAVEYLKTFVESSGNRK